MSDNPMMMSDEQMARMESFLKEARGLSWKLGSVQTDVVKLRKVEELLKNMAMGFGPEGAPWRKKPTTKEVMDDPKTPCRPSWCLELAQKFLDQFDPHGVTPDAGELLANELDHAYLRGRREERDNPAVRTNRCKHGYKAAIGCPECHPGRGQT